jgi:hypothetical protein
VRVPSPASADLTPTPRAPVLALLGAAGLLTIVVGTFLPWLRSGQAVRNSYRAGGALDRLLRLDGPAHAALAAWPFVGAACAVTALLYSVRLVRTAVVLATLLALIAAAVGVTALAAPGGSVVAVELIGPGVTVAGAAVVICAVVLRSALSVRTARSPR